MRVEYFGLLAMVLIAGMFLSALIEDSHVGDSEIENLNTISSYQIVQYNTSGSINIPGSIVGFFDMIMRLLLWDFVFFEGGFEWIRIFILTPITVVVIVGIIFAFANSVFGFFSRG